MLPEPDPSIAAALAADLAAIDYGTDALRDAWGADADGALGRGHRFPAERALARAAADGSSPSRALAVAARLLGLGAASTVADVDKAFPTAGAAGLAALGLVRIEGTAVVAEALIRPQSFVDADGEVEWWIASDLDEAALGGPLPENHVLGVGGASLTLAGLQPTTRVALTLDLGTGCGVQALRARRVSDRVIATDVSERALRFTRLNALLNGVTGIETRRGDLFEPVADEIFDRIVSNPPFVITPRSAALPTYEYRDASLRGDRLVESVVRSAGQVMRPGGTAVLLGNWEYHEDTDGLDRVRTWVEESGLEAWVIERELLDPVAYAELWIRDGGTTPADDAFDAMLGAWLDDFEVRGVSAVGFGYLVLRRPVATGARRLGRFERVGERVADGVLGHHLEAVVEAVGDIASLDDDALIGKTFVVAPDVTEARHHRPGDEAPTVIELHQGGGFGRTVSVDPALAAFVGASDGELSAGALIAAIAQLLEVDEPALRADLVPRIRELVWTGILRPA